MNLLKIRAPATLAACLLLLGATERSEAPAAAREIRDGVGRTIRLPGTPRRIVSMAPSVTEMLVALGLSGRIVGVSDFCALPPSPSAPARIGGLVNPDVERIVSLRPDLAVATTSGNYLEDADRIAALGIPVFTLDTPTVDGVIAGMETLGEVLGAGEQALRVTGDLRARLSAVAERLRGRPRVRVLFVVWGDPILVPGSGAFLNDALGRAGAESVSATAPSRWTEYSLEQVVSSAPDVILTVPDNRAFAESLPADPRWKTVPAVRAGRIHVVGNAIQQPGPEIVTGIEEVAAVLHRNEGGR